MFNVGGGEIAVILILALIVLGPDKLPSAARQAGKYMSEFRRISDGFQRELREAMDVDPPATKPRSATMAPAPSAPLAHSTDERADDDDRAAERESDGTPVGESHRVVETANGPTLPPVVQPTTHPDADRATTIPDTRTTVDSVTGNAIEVDGPASSFD